MSTDTPWLSLWSVVLLMLVVTIFHLCHDAMPSLAQAIKQVYKLFKFLCTFFLESCSDSPLFDCAAIVDFQAAAPGWAVFLRLDRLAAVLLSPSLRVWSAAVLLV